MTTNHRIEVSEVLAEAGLQAEAHELLVPVLTDPDCGYWRLDSVVVRYLSTTDQPDAAYVVAAVQNRSPEVRAHVARGLAEAGYSEAAAAMAEEVMSDPRADGYDISHAATHMALGGW